MLEAVIDGCSAETLNYIVPGSNIGSIGAIYAHAVFDEDGMVTGPIGGTTVYESGGFKDRAELAMPGPAQSQEWSQGTAIDVAAFREYAQAVYAATDVFLANVSDENLAAEVDTFSGKQPLGEFLGTVGLWHITSHQGEISAIKGAQGLRGLPF
jgi:hypothetical protein